MKRPENLDRDARILPDKPNQTSVYDRAVFQRGENARWAKEMEAKLTRVMENLAESHASEVELEEQIEKAAKVFKAQAMPHPMHEWKRHFLRVYLSGEGT